MKLSPTVLACITLFTFSAGIADASTRVTGTTSIDTEANIDQVESNQGKVYISSIDINNSTINQSLNIKTKTRAGSITSESSGSVKVSAIQMNGVQTGLVKANLGAEIRGNVEVLQGGRASITTVEMNQVAIRNSAEFDMQATIYDGIEVDGEGSEVMVGSVRLSDNSNSVPVKDMINPSISFTPVNTSENIALQYNTTALEYAQLSACSYSNKKKCSLPEGWEIIDQNSLEKYGISLENSTTKNWGSGFYAEIFYNKSKKEWVVGFEGTEWWSFVRDWPTNIYQDLIPGYENPQYYAAGKLGKEMSSQAKKRGEKITFTGHSLGGGLASNAGIWTGEKAVTFNAAGLRKKTAMNGEKFDISKQKITDNWNNQDSLIDAYIVHGDELNSLSKIPVLVKPANGKQIFIDNPNGIFEHGTKAITESLGG